MSRIDELIEELSPGGFPRRPLSELCKFTRGSNLEKKELLSEGFPAVHYGEIHTHYGYKTERTKSFVSQIKASKMRKAMPGDLVLVTTSESAVEVAKPLAWLGDLPLSVGGECYIVQSQMDSIFLAHLFQSADFKREIQKFISGTKVKRISANDLGKIAIPAPPLVVQREIVSILDKFTHLEAELEAELEARRIQYEVTRDRLLDFSGDLQGHPLRDELHSLNTGSVKQKKLGEAGQFIRGSGLEKKDLLGSGEPVVHYGEVHTHYGFWTATTKSFVSAAQAKKMRKAAPGDVVIVTTSENHEDVGKPLAWLGSQPLNVGGESYIYQSELDPLYVAQLFMSSSFKRMSRRYISGTKVKRLSSDNLERIEIPVPPLEIQRKIGVALKDLDALLNDITIGLPAEIAARRKQYEFYRNKLLTFKELEAA